MAEISRLILAQAGIEYEDVRLPYEEWEQKKKTFPPFSMLPTLQYDGETICQSIPIARYTALHENNMKIACKTN